MRPLCMFLLTIAWTVLPQDITVLLKMIPAQQKFFTGTVVSSFERQQSSKVVVQTFQDNWDLAGKLSDPGQNIDVVKVPMEMANSLVEKGFIQPLKNVVNDKDLAGLTSQYFLMNLATVNGTVCYIPRKFETRVMVYCRSRVSEAVSSWRSVQDSLDAALRRSVGTGLPAGYALETDPSAWDYWDVLVAGYYWARTAYGGQKAGRIAHRGKDYGGTAVGLMDGCFQFGATKGDILAVDSRFYREVLKWESLYSALGVYPAGMWEKGWGGTDLWKAFGSGEVFLSFLTQIDCYFLHGTESAEMRGFMKDPDDLGFALMPQAVSLDGQIKGTRSISTGGWLWGIGAKSKNPAIALNFIKAATSYESQIAECDAFGIIPVRKDILGKTDLLFSQKWKSGVFTTSLAQLKTNGRTSLPYATDQEKLEKRYNAAWRAVVEKSVTGWLQEAAIGEILQK